MWADNCLAGGAHPGEVRLMEVTSVKGFGSLHAKAHLTMSGDQLGWCNCSFRLLPYSP